MIAGPRLLFVAEPLVPDAEEARRWAENELAKGTYQAAEPTGFDRVARAITEGLATLFSAQAGNAWGPALAVIAIIVALAVIVVAFLIWGRPRSATRTRTKTADLFGIHDSRTADQLREEAAAHAAARRWDEAIVTQFRAVALDLHERGALNSPPGTTAQAFARHAAPIVPHQQSELLTAARIFDDVRYLRRSGTRQLYEVINRTATAIAHSTLVASPEPARI